MMSFEAFQVPCSEHLHNEGHRGAVKWGPRPKNHSENLPEHTVGQTRSLPEKFRIIRGIGQNGPVAEMGKADSRAGAEPGAWNPRRASLEPGRQPQGHGTMLSHATSASGLGGGRHGNNLQNSGSVLTPPRLKPGIIQVGGKGKLEQLKQQRLGDEQEPGHPAICFPPICLQHSSSGKGRTQTGVMEGDGRGPGASSRLQTPCTGRGRSTLNFPHTALKNDSLPADRRGLLSEPSA